MKAACANLMPSYMVTSLRLLTCFQGFSFYGQPLPFFRVQHKQASFTEKLFKIGFSSVCGNNTICMVFKPSWAL